MNKFLVWTMIVALVVCTTLGCSKRLIIPSAIAGAGGAVFLSGVIYRASLPKEDAEGLFGKESKQKAAIGTLMLTGLALIVVGVIWAATTEICEVDSDCWSGDICDKKSQSCVRRPLETPKMDAHMTPVLLDSLKHDRYRLRLNRDLAYLNVL